MLDNVIFKFMIWNCIEYPALKHRWEAATSTTTVSILMAQVGIRGAWGYSEGCIGKGIDGFQI